MKTAIVWFRNDLRLADNPALAAALDQCERCVCVYIHAPQEAGGWSPGAASRWWLHHSLASLGETLAERGNRLVLRSGDSARELLALANDSGAAAVFWNRRYEPALIEHDREIKSRLRQAGLTVESFNAGLGYEPWSLTRDEGQPYRVYTPYWNAARKAGLPDQARPAPQSLPASIDKVRSETLDSFELLPKIAWYSGMAECWAPGEPAAQARLQRFLHQVDDYPEQRDLPAIDGVSRLSPHLHFGEIGPRQIIGSVRQCQSRGKIDDDAADAYLKQLVWRDFAHHTLFHFPTLAEQSLNRKFRDFPWHQGDGEALERWRRGRTGIPIVDAGMHELWQTGWMHNRVRMIVGSWLCKHLMWHWLDGARWFWDTLVDADLANNSFGWQWIAGSGADAAPYFRIFNPVLQGRRFDPEGRYVRRWLPVLEKLDARWIHSPWEASSETRRDAGVELGRDYPQPQIGLKEGRERAMSAYQHLGKAKG